MLHQHGFRKDQWTIGAIKDVVEALTKTWTTWSLKVCILLTLDVKKAFNIVDSYLDGMIAIVETTKGVQNHKDNADYD